MKLGDSVFQNYSGIQRFGKVIEVKENFKGDSWKWVKVDWVDDDVYVTAQKWKAKIRGKDDNHFIPDYHRCDDLQKIDLNKTIHTLLRLKKLI
jgi:tRNA(Glu) U13 pseudouridine synthase TruD